MQSDRRENMRELVPHIELLILDFDKTTEKGKIKNALGRYFGQSQIVHIKVSMIKKAFWGTLKAFLELNEELAARVFHTGYLEVGWVSCPIRKKTEIIRCCRCDGYGHLAVKCEGPAWTKCCWKCGNKGDRAAYRATRSQCYLCIVKESRL